MTARAPCTHCKVPVPTGYRRVVFLEKQFCSAKCLDDWKGNEVIRLRGWLSRIAGRTRGMGSDLATSALYSDRFADT